MTKSPSGTFSEKERGGVISYAWNLPSKQGSRPFTSQKKHNGYYVVKGKGGGYI